VVEGGGAFGLSPEAFDELLVVGVLLPQGFERHVSI
jgi:hypothetical protein